MKFVIRRAVVSVVASPLVAGAYVLAYAVLVGLGAGANVSLADAWVTGWTIAIAVAITFTFHHLVDRLG